MCAAAAGFTEAVRDGLATLAYRLKQALQGAIALCKTALICLIKINNTLSFCAQVINIIK